MVGKNFFGLVFVKPHITLVVNNLLNKLYHEGHLEKVKVLQNGTDLTKKGA
jgi:hypothetical protein